jgi:hypothetical protein
VHCGATPVFVDVNADDFNISIARAEISSKLPIGVATTYKMLMRLFLLTLKYLISIVF